MSPVSAPFAPGTLGAAIDPQALMRYLDLLQTWLERRRQELDELDRAAQSLPAAAQLTSDITLSMALWQAVKSRHELLVATWDSGRVGVSEREKMSVLIWGRLDTTASSPTAAPNPGLAGMNVSLPEACRISDALAASLRQKLQLDPAVEEMAARVKNLRAQMERLRDQAALEPAGPERAAADAKVAALRARVESVKDKLSRGGDVGGLLGPLEMDSARYERDLIVGAALRRKNQAKAEEARERLAELSVRQAALSKLVETCVRTVAPAPKFAVPNVDALGTVPATGAEIDTFLDRLRLVSQAMQLAQTAYSKALHDREDLLATLKATEADAAGIDDADLATLHDLAARSLARTPAPIPTCRNLVDAYQAAVQQELTARKDGKR